MNLDAAYWRDRYQNESTGWDIGHPNFGLINEVKTRFPRSTKILIPGAGRGYEAEALWSEGFHNTYVCDWAPEAFSRLATSEVLAKAFPDKKQASSRLIITDFFTLNDSYDLILEQTFFCAIDPGLRKRYVEQAFSLLKPGGKWLGILFDCYFLTPGPPFGGSVETYTALFSSHFEILLLEGFEGSIAPRKGKELLGLMHCKSA